MVKKIFTFLILFFTEIPFPEEIFLKAKKQEWIKDFFWIGEGEVEVLYNDLKINADKLIYDFVNAQIEAEGNILFKSKDGEIKALKMFYNLKEKKGYFEGVNANFKGDYYFNAERIEKVGENSYKIFKGEFTSCSPEDPSWSFKIKKSKFKIEDYAYLYGTSFAVKNKSIFYLPFIIWPTKRERSAGFLIPKFGHSFQRGAYLGLSYFLPIRDSYDLTFGVDLFSEGYLGRNLRFRYTPLENMEGKFSAYFIKDDNKNRWKINFDHKQKAFGNFKLEAKIERLSDIDFLKEFEQMFDRNTNRQIYSHISLSGNYLNNSILIKTDRKEIYFTLKDKYIFEQYPKIEVRLRPFSIFSSNINFSYQFRLNNLRVDKGPFYKGEYLRGDFFPNISYSFSKLPFLNISPTMGYRYTYYSRSLNESGRFEEKGFMRKYFYLGGKAVGPSFSKIFNTKANTYKHKIEPILEYIELSHLKTKNPPLFDENDYIATQKQIKFSLINRVLKKTKSGGIEIFAFELSQRFSLIKEAPLTQIYENGILKKSQKGALDFNLRGNFSQNFSFTNQFSMNSINKKLQNFNLSLDFFSKGNKISFSYNFVNSFSQNLKDSEFLRLKLNFFPFKFLSFASGITYDIKNKFPSQQEYSIGFLGSCYSVNLEYRDFRSSYRVNREWRIIVNLKNVGSFIDVRGEITPYNY